MQQQLANIPDVVYSMTGEGILSFISGNCQGLLGQPAEKLVSKSLIEVFIDAGIDALSQLDILRSVKEAVKRQAPCLNYEACIVKLNRQCFLEIREEYQYDDSGKLTQSTGVIRDITERKVIETNLERKLAEFQIVSNFGTRLNRADSVDNAFDILGEELQILIPSAYLIFSCLDDTEESIRIQKTIGFSEPLLRAARALGLDFYRYQLKLAELSSLELKHYTSGNLNLIEDGVHYLFKRRISKLVCTSIEKVLGIKQVMTMGFSFNGKPKGGVSLLLKNPEQLENKALIESLIKQAAITIDAKKAELSLKESEKKYRELVEKADVAIAIDDIDGNITFCNQVFANLFGYPIGEILKSNHRTMSHPEDFDWIHRIHNKRMKGEEVPDEYEFRGIRKDGKIVWIMLKSSPVIEKGRITGTRNYFWDITERKLNELTLTQAKEKAEESDRLKSAFLQNLSHEIRTPLNGILGFSSLLDEEDLDSDSRATYLEIIHKNGDHLLHIIDDIIDISRIESGQLELVEEHFKLSPILQKISEQYKLQCNSKGIDFATMISPGVPDHLVTDRTKLERVLNSLLSNAVKFTPHGHIFLKVQRDVQRTGSALFIVEDTGIGVEPEYQSIIFERFRQADTDLAIRNGGTGLGLAIAKGMVSLLKGTLNLDSIPGAGSKFYFSIPIS